ncbi:helix-turn-helix domain-containing protein [Amycolatopsis anabasis]|uniref:helix-turn-helix domain-containing protein n=1 Tax=Amycolatopsis anabasis TaxID=1840409 RepID=UPI0015D3582D|nr:helix-turn-helix transcriptional regulator [Amycolatopsis anabasis]
MSGKSNTNRNKRRLGRKLREMRERADMTLNEAAARLDKTRTSMHRIETGETLADVHLIRTMMDIYDERDDSLLDLSRAARKRGWWYPYLGPTTEPSYVEDEAAASRVLSFAVTTIPGLLQTEDYTRALFAGLHNSLRESRVEDLVTVRRIRQERLSDEENPLHVHAVIDELALLRQVGGREVMRDQLRHLIEMANLPTVTLQVLPSRLGAHSSMEGAFTVLSFPEPDEPDVQYVSYRGGRARIDKPDRVRETRLVFDHLSAIALAPEESARPLEEVIAERYDA